MGWVEEQTAHSRSFPLPTPFPKEGTLAVPSKHHRQCQCPCQRIASRIACSYSSRRCCGKGNRDRKTTKRVTRFKRTMAAEPQFVSGVWRWETCFPCQRFTFAEIGITPANKAGQGRPSGGWTRDFLCSPQRPPSRAPARMEVHGTSCLCTNSKGLRQR